MRGRRLRRRGAALGRPVLRAGELVEVCTTSWSTGQDPTPLCERAHFVSSIDEYPDCGGYDIVIEARIDSADLYYYDKQSHALVGVRILGGTDTNCRAGSCPPIREAEIAACHDAGAPITLCHQDDAGTLVPAYAPADAGPHDAAAEVF